MNSQALVLLMAVAGVGILHTVVPDHWAPIALLARQHGWSRRQTAAVALRAGVGHVLSTLAIGLLVWGAGLAFAARFGNLVDLLTSLALVGFGGWIAVSSLIGMHGGGHSHGAHTHGGHGHHQHGGHDHVMASHHHEHHHHEHHDEHGGHNHGGHVAPSAQATSRRTALLLIMGSSPMVEGIPAFLAAQNQGLVVLMLMAAVFSISTIATYVVLCVCSAAGLQHLRLGNVERYGEVLSGALIALVGIATWVWPLV